MSEFWNERASEIWGEPEVWQEALADSFYIWGGEQVNGGLNPDSDFSARYVDWIGSGAERHGIEYWEVLVEVGVVDEDDSNAFHNYTA